MRVLYDFARRVRPLATLLLLLLISIVPPRPAQAAVAGALRLIPSVLATTPTASPRGIHGAVKSSTGPIVGASVRLLEIDRSATTDARGEFSFPELPNGTYTVFARVIGYTTAQDTVRVADNVAEVAITLRVSAIAMPEVVVSSTPYARTSDDQYQSAESKSLVELHQSAGTSFAEKISDLPGVAVRWNASSAARPILRGLSDNRVLILENGLRTGDLSTYDPAHATPIEALDVSEIDVVRGPASVFYGPSTIGGLVNVITNTIPQATTRPIAGTLSLAGNSVSDEYGGSFNGVLSKGGHAFGVSGGGLHTEDIRIPNGTYNDGIQDFQLSHIPQSFNHTGEGSAGYSYQGAFGMVGVGGKYYKMNYGIPGTPPNDNWETLGDPAATSRITQEKKTGEARGEFNIQDSFLRQVRVNANYVDYNHSEFPTNQDSTGVSEFLATHFHKQQFNGMVELKHQRSARFQGTLGLWMNTEDMTIDGDQPLGPNSLTTGYAGYLFEEYLASERTRFQVGVRYDYNHIKTKPNPTSTDSVFQTLDEQRTSNAVTASLGMVNRLPNQMTFSVNLARSFRAPTVQELFANGLDAPSQSYTIGDPDLKPETGFGIDASLKGNYNKASFELSPYVNFISNYIYAFETGAQLLGFPVRQFAATDAQLTGFEASGTMLVARNLALKASADYVQAEDTKNNVPLPFTPPLHALVRASYQDNFYAAMAEVRFAAAQTRLGDGDTPTSAYNVTNVGVGVRFPQGGLVHNISVRCDNVFDQVYRDNLSVIKDFVPMPGRGVRFNYDLIF
jgi:iron complex outermembrane recepter protein